ncbi:MAG TPA: FAD-dependent oxidoreductase [Candidatus Methylomirabilis sp.]|jgi:ferredoxin-NADP reductase
MATYQVRLKSRAEVAEGTMAFHFEKPSDFAFTAGQFVNLSLVDPPETDDEGDDRTFSIASAPSEPELVCATRMRDTAFKRVLKAAPMGTAVMVAGASGRMVLHDDPGRPAAFLAGGIGITPFRSIIVQAARDRAPHRLFLFYSNRRPEDAAYLDELQGLQRANDNYRFIGTMTDMAKSRRPWAGETGYINGDMLARHLGSLTGPIYYIVGPPPLVDAMRKMLADAGVPGTDIRIEKFAGY